MRLKLNRTLRAALIAAISTVGFTLTQAQAADVTLLTTTFNVTTDQTTAWTVTDTSEVGLTTSNWTLVKSTDGTTVVNSRKGEAGQLRPNTNVQTDNGSGWVLTFDITNGGQDELTLNTLSLDTFIFNGSNEYQQNGTDRKFNATLTYGNPSQSLSTGEFIIQGKGDAHPDNGVVNFDFTEAITLGASKSLHVSVKFERTTEKLGCFVGLNNISVLYTPEVVTSTWQGTTEHNTWSDNQAWDNPPSANAAAVFNGNAEHKTVSIGAATTADSITVDGAAYIFEIGEAGSLSTQALSITGTGAKLTVNGEGRTMTIAEISNDGELAIGAGATVNLTASEYSVGSGKTFKTSGEGLLTLTTLKAAGGTINVTSALNVTGGGEGKGGTNRSLGLAITSADSTVNLEGTTHISGAIYAQAGTVNIGNGSDAVRVTTNRVEFGDTSGAGASVLNIKANATLHVKGTDTANSYADTALLLGEWVGVSTVNIAGKLYADNATAYVGDSTATFNIENGGVMAVKGLSQNQHKDDKSEILNLNLKDGGKLVLGANGVASQKPINLSLAAGEVGISAESVTIAKDIALSGTTTTFNTAMYEWQGEDDTRKLVAGTTGGTLTISGNITGTGTITKTGAGTLVLSGEANVLNKTIAVQNGTLQLNGKFDITGNEGEMTTTYSEGNNGFKTTSGTITVYTKGEGAEVTIGQGAQFIYDEATITLSPEGKYAASARTDYTTFYVRVGSANFSSALAQQDMQYVEMSDNTTLNMDTSGALTSLTTHGAASLVNVGEDRHSLTLGSVAGEGTVAVGDKIDVTIAGTISGTKNLTALKLASDATAHVTMGNGKEDIVNFGAGSGTVVLEGGNFSYRSNLNGNTLQMQDGSMLLFGNRGDDTDHTYEGSIVVAGNANVQTYGTSQHSKATISGEVSGDGTLTRANDGNQTLEFSGKVDLGGYTNNDAQGGNLTDFKGVTKIGTLTVGNASKTKFSNESTTIGAVVVNGTGTTEFAHDVSIADVSSTGGHQWTLNALDSATVTVTDEAGSLYKLQTNGNVVLAEGTTMTLDNNLVPFSGTLAVNGVVNVKGDVDLSEHNASTGTLAIGATGQVTAAGMWMRHEASITLEQGGQLNVAGLNIVGNGTNSSIAYNPAGESQYGTNNADFTIANAKVNVTGEVTLGNTLSSVDVVVAEGGVLTLSDTAVANSVTVEDGGTIAGGVDAKDVAIAAGGTATFNEGISDTTAGVYIINVSEGAPTVTNNGETDAKYAGLQDASMTVTAETLMSEATASVVVNNGLAVKSIHHDSSAELTLTHVDTDTLEGVYAYDGAITLQNITAVSLTEMTIDPAATVQVIYTDEQQATQEGTVTITETLAAGGGTLLANLTIADADLEDGVNPLLNVNGGGDYALTLGSQFGIAEGTLVTLDDVTIAILEDMQIGGSLDLIKAQTGTELTYLDPAYDGMWFGQLFERTDDVLGDYRVYATESAFGLTKVSNTPEPTTGTLSLLALAALAARRRRK